jgi:hypothetical protein
MLRFLIALLIFGFAYPVNAFFVAGRRDVTPMGETSLNTGQTYGANVLRAFLFDEGSGSTVNDYSTEAKDATLSNATWGDQGVTIDGDTEYVYCESPTTADYTNSFSFFFVFRSTGTSGAGNSEYGKFFVHDTADSDLQIYRYASDTSIRAQIDGQTLDFGATADVWDTYSHTILVTFDDDSDANQVCLYIDGALEACDTSETFSIPTLTTDADLGIGNRSAAAGGSRPINGIVSLAMIWTTELDADDAASLHASPYQMFDNPPSRTWYEEEQESYIETHYVTQSGAGSQNGTSEANAWPLYLVGTYTAATHSTSAAADGKIGPGDRILYYGTLTGTINNAVSGTQTNRIYHDGTNATINASGNAFVSTGFDYLTIQNFDFANVGDNTIELGTSESVTADHITIDTCTFGTQTGGSCYIEIKEGSSDWTFTNLTWPESLSVLQYCLPNYFYESFESYATNTNYDPDHDGNSDGVEYFRFDVNDQGYANNGNNLVLSTEESITARYGDKYFKMYVTIDDCDTIYEDAYKTYATLESPELTSNLYFNSNDGTEYWIGYSLWIPSDYYLERYHSGVYQLFDGSNGAQLLVKTFGTDDQTTDGGWDYNVNYSATSGSGELFESWEGDKGSWVDIVFQFVLYDEDNANARMNFYKNGVVSAIRPNGQDNIETDSTKVYFDFVQYNSGFANCNGLTAEQCEAYVYQCAVDPFVAFERALWIDEFRFKYASMGENSYCDVAPPIWSSAPTITNPTQGETGISLTETLTYGAYADHRTDGQSCFDRTTTEIQIDEDGGDWSTLVYHNTNAGATSQVLLGTTLDAGTTYQMRVRHISLRAGTTDTYDGVWSTVHDFTTAP